MKINEVIKCINVKGSKKVTLSQYIGDVTITGSDEKIGELLTDLSNLTIMFEDLEGNVFALDTDKFITYITGNKQELINKYKSKEGTVKNE